MLVKFFILVSLLLSTSVRAVIEDNSFLLEEAFNQEYGVYQFIQKTVVQNGTYYYSFENEIPLTDKVHQFSYNLPVLAQGSLARSVGDVGLNYRYQSINRDGLLMADRLSLVIPTGDVDKDNGNGVFGFQYMHSISIKLAEKWMNHWNLGFSMLPNAKSSTTHKRMNMNNVTAGTSFIYLASDDFNLMLEGMLTTDQGFDDQGIKESQSVFTLNPGVRFAIDDSWKGAQIVPGMSFPMEMSNNKTNFGVLFYLSFEPKFY